LRTPSGGGLCADPVQKRVPGEKDIAKRGLTPTGPLQKGGQRRVPRGFSAWAKLVPGSDRGSCAHRAHAERARQTIPDRGRGQALSTLHAGMRAARTRRGDDEVHARAPSPTLHGAGNRVTPRILGSRPVRLPAARALRAPEARPSHPCVARNCERRPTGGRAAMRWLTKLERIWLTTR
jgi:hypothetical protein